MNWKTLASEEALQDIIQASEFTPQVIFKHSTRCSISQVVKNRLDKSDAVDGIAFHYLDLIANRNVSNQVAEIFSVDHQSPQVLLIKNRVCIYDESHQGIFMDEIIEQAIESQKA